MNEQTKTSPASETSVATLGLTTTHKRGELAVSASAARAKAEVEARFTIALNRPRNTHEVRRRILEACQRPLFAEGAIYRKPVGGSTIDGFSIRFAEEAIKSMGNITVESPVVWEDDERRTVRITVTDLESNTSYAKDINLAKTVERRTVKQGTNVLGERKNSIGQTVYLVEATEDEMQQKVAAAESKVIRNSGLRLIPSDILDEAWELVNKTQKKGGSDPQAETKKIVDAFASINVGPAQIEKYLGHELATVSPKELSDLRAVFTAIRDGDASWNDYVTQTAVQAAVAEVVADMPKAKPVRSAAAAKAPQPVSAAHKLLDLRAKITESGVSEADFVVQLAGMGVIEDGLSLEDAAINQPSAISAALNGFNTVLKAIKEGKE